MVCSYKNTYSISDDEKADEKATFDVIVSDCATRIPKSN